MARLVLNKKKNRKVYLVFSVFFFWWFLLLENAKWVFQTVLQEENLILYDVLVLFWSCHRSVPYIVLIFFWFGPMAIIHLTIDGNNARQESLLQNCIDRNEEKVFDWLVSVILHGTKNSERVFSLKKLLEGF